MTKYSIFSSIAAAALLLLCSCSKENGFSEAGDITIQASVGAMTKVSYDGNQTTFTAGDQIVVYGWTGSAAEVPAMRVVDGVANTLGTDGKWTPESPMLWKNVKDQHYFLGVFPARTITDFTADPYTLDPAKYEESDLLVATNVLGLKAQGNPVALSFDHALAKLVVNLKFRSQWETEPTVTSVTAMAKKTATVNYLAKAKLTVTGTAEAVALSVSKSNTWSGLQVPQEGVRRVIVTINNKEYVYESATDIPLNAGQYTTLDLMVGRDRIELGSISVTDWAAGTVLPDGEAELVNSFSAARYLTFTSEGTTKISLLNNGGNAPKLYYSTDKTNWIKWDYSELTFTSSAPLYLCGDNPNGFSASDSKSSNFVDSGSNYSVSGDIMSLLNKNSAIRVIPNNWCFCLLFMNCTGLTAGPDLPATTLAEFCYLSMFNNCTGLTAAPDLPATTLAKGCYEGMFYYCTGLTAAPELPASILTDWCYAHMFEGCTKLSYVKCLATDISAVSCVGSWLDIVAPSGTFITAEGMNDWPSGESGIPYGWIAIPVAADLGLPSGLKWATCNVGAARPDDCGDYFAWGETETYYSSLNPLTWKDGKGAGYDWSSYQFGHSDEGPFSKYNATDKLTALETGPNGDDVASKVLGGSWRMPTHDEWGELMYYCTWEWKTTADGYYCNGYLVSGNGNSIFLPAAGVFGGTNFNNLGDKGGYWSSTFDPSNERNSYIMKIRIDSFELIDVLRCYGYSIRAVTE